MTPSYLLSILLLSLAVALTGCFGDVGHIYRISDGEDPQSQDKNVRFRTTYYFRVFDVCQVDQGLTSDGPNGTRRANYTKRMGTLRSREHGTMLLMRDSLYRFRMTGKASAYFSNVHFESGILGADQIDPFGGQVEYDEDQRTFSAPRSPRSPVSSVEPPTEKTIYCPDGDPAHQLFMLLGPEGIKLLNRNERLVLAMYSDSKPLISLLRQASNQPEKERQARGTVEELGAQRIRLSHFMQGIQHAQGILQQDSTNPDLSPDKLLQHLFSSIPRLLVKPSSLSTDLTGGQP